MKYLKEKDVVAVFGLDPQYDIDRIKKQCEIYKDEMKFEEGVQMKL